MRDSLSTGSTSWLPDKGNMEECFDIAIVGSGVSCAYTLIHYVSLLEEQAPAKPVRVIVLEKSGEFWSGFPYGFRSGRYSLLITSLKEFLPQDAEREAFAKWLDRNRDWIFERFMEGDGEFATKWLRTHERAMSAGLWDDLFLPRYTFGVYLQNRLADLLKGAATKGILNCTLMAAEVVDVERLKQLHRIHFVAPAAGAVQARKVIIGMGSTRNSVVERSWTDAAGRSECLIDDMYEPSMELNVRRIVDALRQSQGRSKQVLIVGANASALEALFWLNNSGDLNGLISKFCMFSMDAAFPHRISRETKKAIYSPMHLEELMNAGTRTAAQILEAIRKDVAHATAQGLNIADLFDDISKGMMKALNQLGSAEQKRFVTQYGVEVGRLQRRAGAEYLDVVHTLSAEGRLELFKGRCVKCVALGDGDLGCEVAIGEGRTETVLAGPFGVVINAGFQDVTQSSSPLMRNLIRRGICVPNESKRGFLINEKYETSEGCHLMGPLVAGNMVGKLWVWHAESCSRIIDMSLQLAEVLINFSPEKGSGADRRRHEGAAVHVSSAAKNAGL